MEPKGLKEKGILWLKGTGRPALNRFLARYSKIGDPVIFDNALFPWAKKFEENYEAIRAEAVKLEELRDQLPAFHEVSPYQNRISDNDMWKTAWLYGFGYRSEVVSELCPVTAELIQEVPDLMSAFFSMLAPGKHIPPHRGVYKGLINYHLGVIIPKHPEKAQMRIADERFYWEAGKSRIFDDTNDHEVWNESGEERVVLFLQVHRPFSLPGRIVSQLFLKILLHTAYLKVPLRNIRKLDKQLRAAATERGLLPASS